MLLIFRGGPSLFSVCRCVYISRSDGVHVSLSRAQAEPGPSGAPHFESIDTDGNGCITQDEFNQNAGEGAPAFGAVAQFDGIAECISRDDLYQYMGDPEGGAPPLSP